MFELPCQAVFSLPDVHALTPDCPLRCEIQSLKGLSSPSVGVANGHLRKGQESLYLSGALARWGIFLHPKPPGFAPWLILSYLYAEVGSPAQHTSVLALHELQPAVYWCPTPAAIHIQWGENRVKRFSVRLTKTHKREMFSEFGSPSAEGEWLAVRLLPRRRPAALRIPAPGALTLFIPLDTA